MKRRLTAVVTAMLVLPLYGWLHTPEADATLKLKSAKQGVSK